ncbi:NAD(P)/FAD-dependent oxidoreductase [Flectobacillus longus]|uniref:FAD/NAD(P)-binding oxidoreductase n=1 Tax=Flectobacillus longus TaxID=2984207 RepID=A0ABT6YR04_9BACT|nr:FAD/NAD(P)-binding oxidoreductase [Flectobacillus longus]MDI9866012.1 FAD/NAD(P)-binding oxidoreductase [Flectobacillus longus]MDI9882584.1 FAD/NAD(P)-binding oxidoreductase [Flectobacillus longus]
MNNQFEVLIVGGGNAGLSVAAQLSQKKSGLSIGIVEPSEKHYYQPAWTLVGAGEFNIADTEKNEKDYIPAGSIWIKDAVATFEPEQNQVTCKSGAKYTYKILIVAPGIQIDWQNIKGLSDTLGKNEVSSNYSFEIAPYTWELIKNFKGGVAVFTNPSTAIKCGGAPHKIMYLACDYWRKKGILEQCEVHYVSGAGVIFGVKEYAQTLEKVVADNHIFTHFGANTVAIDGKSKTILYEQKNANGEIVHKSLSFDMCHAVPPQSAPDFIKKSPLADPKNTLGYVEINKNTMQHSRYPNVFALGDCTNAPCSKTGAAIRKQAPVVVENVLRVLAQQQPTAEYTGYSACPIPTQYGKLMLAEFDYSNTPKMTFPFDQAKPRWSMWLLKKYILPWLYWNRILTGKA